MSENKEFTMIIIFTFYYIINSVCRTTLIVILKNNSRYINIDVSSVCFVSKVVHSHVNGKQQGEKGKSINAKLEN